MDSNSKNWEGDRSEVQLTTALILGLAQLLYNHCKEKLQEILFDVYSTRGESRLNWQVNRARRLDPYQI